MMRLSALFALFLLCWGMEASAQDRVEPQPDPLQDEAVVDDVVVTGTPLEALTRQFTEEASKPVAGRGLARWAEPVCIGVFNLRADVGRQIADGLAYRGGEFGVPINDSACQPNVLIVGVDDGKLFASEWVSQRYRDFRPAISDSAGSREELEYFQTTDAAVRWWSVSRPTYFNILRGVATPTGGPGAAAIEVFAKSQLRSRIRDDLETMYVVLDVTQASSAPPSALIDYLAMVVFAQIDMRSEMGAFDSILNLFARDDGPVEMTAWDRAYMESLYSADGDRRLNRVQQAEHFASRLTPTATAD